VIFHQCYIYVRYESVVLRNYERTLQSATKYQGFNYQTLQNAEVMLYNTVQHYSTLWTIMECKQTLQSTTEIGTHAMALWHYRPLHNGM
jgi:hypothetical protein